MLLRFHRHVRVLLMDRGGRRVVGRIPLTPAGVDQVRAELAALKALRQALREEDVECAKRAARLEAVLAEAEIFDVSRLRNHGAVVFGSSVVVTDLTKGSRSTYRIVGDVEAEVTEGAISSTSPMGKALIGRRPGDVIILWSPRGDVRYKVAEILYR